MRVNRWVIPSTNFEFVAGGLLFCSSSALKQWHLSPTCLLPMWYRIPAWVWQASDYSPVSNSEVDGEWGFISTPLIHPHSVLLRYTGITSTYQPTNAHIISHKTFLKHFKTLRHVSILSDHHQGALFLAKVILQYSQFNSYLQTRCCSSISCCVGMCCGAVARCASYNAHLATAPQHNTSFANTNWIVNTIV